MHAKLHNKGLALERGDSKDEGVKPSLIQPDPAAPFV